MLRRLQYWLRSTRRDEALREEIELHLAEKAADLEAAGLPPDRARLEARRRFGNVELTREQSREIWMTRFFSELGQDLRYALRAMASNKVFSALAVLSLALGIGANTAIYSFMEAILLRSLPVADPASLAVLNWRSPTPFDANRQWAHVMHGISGRAWPAEKGAMNAGMFPYAAYELFRQDTSLFSTLFGYYDGRKRSLAANGQALQAPTQFVSGDYFRGLAVAPAAGRLIDSTDDRPGASPVAVLSFAASQQRFGSPALAIGQSVRVDNVPMTVVGVTPPEFFGVDPAEPPALFLPLRATLLLDPAEAPRLFSDPNFYWLEMMGRLRPGVTLDQAQAALAPRFHQWVASTATTDAERARLPQFTLNPGASGLGGLRREYSKPLYVLLAMVALILAITCANIANLLLARAAARRREMAVRLSLGAGRFRVVRQLLTESVLLASLGGALGVLFASWGVRVLTFLFSRGRENFTLHAQLNWNVLAVTAALTLACGLLFGLVPALQATRPDVLPALKSGRGAGSRHRLQHVLVVSQIAMSFLILVAAGLFVQTLHRLHAVPLGYARDNILLFTINARQSGHRDPEISAFYGNLRQRFEALPGVASASLSHASIISSGHAGATYRGAIKVGSTDVQGASVLVAGPRYLATMRIPLLAGREFDDRDQPAAPPVAIITERFARAYFGAENPIGRRLTFVNANRELEIVSVSADFRQGSLKDADSPMTVFIPFTQFAPEGMTFALRTAGDPLSLVTSVREIVREADPNIPVTNVLTQAAEIDRTISREITFAHLCTGFALLALLTACIGLYGTLSYSVERQFSELGIRMALGAPRASVLWMVLRRVLLLAAAGLALSLPAAYAAARLLKSLLFGIQPTHPTTLLAATTVLLLAALLAGYAPARRASQIDPLVALRHD